MSLYDFRYEYQIKQFDARVEKIKKLNPPARVELIVRTGKRTLKQNNYLYLLLTKFAIEYGETVEYVKNEIFKKQVNSELFIFDRLNPKTGKTRPAVRSSSDLDTKELTDAIEKFRNYSSSEFGVYLPEPNETEYLESIENEAEKYKRWL